MMDRAFVRVLVIGFALSLSMAFAGPEWVSASGAVAGVKVSADGKHVTVLCDGPVGGHSTSVLGNPNRLVIDLRDTALRGTPRKMQVNKEPIKEIRLGRTPSRARVVIDFGDSPLPSHRIHREDNALVLILGKPAPKMASPSGTRVANLASSQKVEPNKPGRDTSARGKESNLAIRSAEIDNGLIVLSLSDRKRPERAVRLTVDVDMNRLQVRQASLNEAPHAAAGHGARQERPRSGPKNQASMAAHGPRKAPEPDSAPAEKKYHWGQPTVQPRGPDVTAQRPPT
jgi:hypothetical protein